MLSGLITMTDKEWDSIKAQATIVKKEEPFVTYDYQIERLTKYLKIIRLVYGFTVGDIANMLSKSRATVSKYENGSAKITPVEYLAFRGLFNDIAYRIKDTFFYIAVWDYFIEGIDNNLNEITVSEVDALSNKILEISNDRTLCPAKMGAEYRGEIIKRYLETKMDIILNNI